MRSVLAAFTLLLAGTAHAETPEQALAKFVDGVQSLQAGFTQTQTDEKGGVLNSSVGSMALSRPGRFRWQYQKPAEQLIVTDGKTLWLYDQDLRQVTIRPAEEALQGTPAALLSQKKTLTEAFTLADAGQDGDIHKLKLTPKSADSDFKSVDLWLKGGAPVRMLFRDQLGGATDISFSQIKTNLKLDDAQFRYLPAKGVEVIDAVKDARR